MFWITTTKKALRQVFSQPLYIFISLFSSTIVFVLGNVLPNLTIFSLLSNIESYSARFKIFLGSMGYFIYNGTILTQVSFILTVILSGVAFSLAVFYMRKTVFSYKTTGMGFLGTMAAILGIGCGACGSVLLSMLIGFGASTYVTSFLPLHGIEFGIMGNLIAHTDYTIHK